MTSHVEIDEKLLAEVVRLGEFKTSRGSVHHALTEWVQRVRQNQMLEWEGKVDFFEDYDHKKHWRIR